MQRNNVSEAICSTSTGWFRYNYDENRLEFLNHDTKLVVQTWSIPADQWEALPSQQEYCENIVNQAQNQATTHQKRKEQRRILFVVSAIIAVVCFYLTLSGTVKSTNADLLVYGIGLVAISVAVVNL